jgi:hypothetical protein
MKILLMIIAYFLTFVISIIFGCLMYSGIVLFFTSLKRAWKGECRGRSSDTFGELKKRNVIKDDGSILEYEETKIKRIHIIGFTTTIIVFFIILTNSPKFGWADPLKHIIEVLVCGGMLWFILLYFFGLIYDKRQKWTRRK